MTELSPTAISLRSVKATVSAELAVAETVI